MSGNVQLASEGQFDELRICVEKSFNKLRGRLDAGTVQDWIGNSFALDQLVEGLILPTKAVVPKSILELVSTVVIPATIAKFVAKDKFVINTKRNASVKISSLGDNFTGWFLSGDSKIEDPISAQTFCCHKLRKSSANGPIIKELGGEAKAEAILSEMFSLLEKQGHGEEGILLTNGWANIFYIRDLAGVLRVVFVRWCDGDWFVSAYAVESPRVWGGGGRVFSRNSALKSFVTAVV